MIKIDLRQLPPEGKLISGESPNDIFQLAPDDPAKPDSPLTYRLKVLRTGDFLQLEGSLEAVFVLECGRCLQHYRHAVRLPDYFAEITLENGDIIDLTPRLREDILLDLPGYPRCDDGNVEKRECPAKDAFEVRESEGQPAEEPNKENVWGALDDIDINP